MKKIQKHHLNKTLRIKAFTLVEMLVAVALVVLMMSLFATVFQSAAETMSLQKGLAENNQRSRMLNTIIRQDIKNRTFSLVIPWLPGEVDEETASLREGYFYISENNTPEPFDPNDSMDPYINVTDDVGDDTDDVLQFTVRLNPEDPPFYGKATLLGAITDINQPEGDDGQVYYVDYLPSPPIDPVESLEPNEGAGSNNQGASRTAEISYFVRNGNLYRRVLLVRERFSTVGNWPAVFNDSTDYPNFWHDFDYSAHYLSGIRLHRQDVETGGTQAVWITNNNEDNTLGRPFYRFGHHIDTGDPLEFITVTPVPSLPDPKYIFIGRYTHRETSDLNFKYPGALPTWDHDNDGGATTPEIPINPMNRNTIYNDSGSDVNYLQVSNNGVVQFHDFTTTPVYTEYDGERIGEDLLLSQVHSFDVKIWDDVLKKFVDIGHEEAGGYFNQSNNQLPGYGPKPSDNRIYDTWHPNVDHLSNGTGSPDDPPFYPLDGSSPVPLKAIQIIIRFYDVASEQTRQITIIESLTD